MFSSQAQGYEAASQYHGCILVCRGFKTMECLHAEGLEWGGRKRGSRAKPRNDEETAFLGATTSDAWVWSSVFEKSELMSLSLTCRETRRHRAVLRLLRALPSDPPLPFPQHPEARARVFRSAEHPWKWCGADQHCQRCCGVLRDGVVQSSRSTHVMGGCWGSPPVSISTTKLYEVLADIRHFLGWKCAKAMLSLSYAADKLQGNWEK